MEQIRRILALIICFQLAWGCTGGGGSKSVVKSGGGSGSGGSTGGSGSGGSETLTISGSIAGVFHSFSNLLIPSASAAVGQITVYDVSDPNNQVPIGNPFDIEDEAAFSLEISKEDIQGKVIKLQYISSDLGKERDLLIAVGAVDITADEMNEDATVYSRVIEHRLILEGSSDKDRLQELFDHKSEVDEQLSYLGDIAKIKKLLIKKDKIRDIISFVAQRQHMKDNGKDPSELDGQLPDLTKWIFEKFKEDNMIEESEMMTIRCDGDSGYFSFAGDKSFKVLYLGTDFITTKNSIGFVDNNEIIGNSDEGTNAIKNFVSRLKDLQGNVLQGNPSGIVIFRDVNGELPDQLCPLSASDETEGEIAEKLSLSFELLDELDVGRVETYQDGVIKLDDLKSSVLKNFTAMNLDSFISHNQIDDIMAQNLRAGISSLGKNYLDFVVEPRFKKSFFKIDLESLESLSCDSGQNPNETLRTALIDYEKKLEKNYFDISLGLLKKILGSKGIDTSADVAEFQQVVMIVAGDNSTGLPKELAGSIDEDGLGPFFLNDQVENAISLYEEKTKSCK
jgi:hypothetical protein